MCISEYKEILRKNPDEKAQEEALATMRQVLTEFGTDADTTTKEGLVNAGDELVKQGFLVSNKLLQDYQDSHPDYTDGEIKFDDLPMRNNP